MLGRAVASLLAGLIVSAPVRAQIALPRGDTDCSESLTAADLVSSVAALGGDGGCGNDDCDRDGAVTSADVDCALQCLFGSCPIPANAPRVTSVAPEFGSGIAPFSTIRVEGTGFGSVDDTKFVTIGGISANIVEVVDEDTLLVFVPALDPAPAEIVVNVGAVDGFPFPLTIAPSAPVGDPDTFDQGLDAIGVALERLSALPLEILFADDAPPIRQGLDQVVAEIATQRAALASDPAFTPEMRAMLDAAFDSSGVAEELREAIAFIEDLLEGGSDGAGGQVSGPDLDLARKAVVGAIIAVGGVAFSAAALLGAPIAALVALGVSLGVSAGLLETLLVAENPPRITKIVFTDGDGRERPHPTAGGRARIQGVRFAASDTTVRIDLQRMSLISGAQDQNGDLVVTLPDRSGFCGPAAFTLLRLGIASNKFPANVQPELFDLSLDRARIGQSLTLQVRGTDGCEAFANFSMDPGSSRGFGIAQLTNRAAQLTIPPSLPEGTYRMRVAVNGLPSREEERLEITPALTGVSASCAAAEIKFPPGSPSTTACTCTPVPDTVPLGGLTFGFTAAGGTLNVAGLDGNTAMIAAALPGDGGSVTCSATFSTRRPLESQPFAIKVIDDTSPTVTLSEPPPEVDPGGSIDLNVVAVDNDFVSRLVLDSTGDAVVTALQEFPCIDLEARCERSFTLQVKRGGFTNRVVTLRASAFDAAGNEGVSRVGMFLVREPTETTPPVVSIQNPRSGGRVRAGDMVQVSVRLTDNAPGDSGVERVRIDVTGPAVASGLVPAEATLPLPLAAATRSGTFAVRPASELANITNRTITITATAFDAAGNMASDTITVMAAGGPVINSVFPSPAVAGQIIRIVGDGFGEEQGSSTVSVGGGVSGLTSWSNNEILALLPENATGMVTVVVTVDGMASNAFPVTVLGSGDVRITLIWDDVNDLDLFVTDPNGDVIFFGSRSSPSGGMLDVDANANCGSVSAAPRENIFWPTGAAPTGTYNVEVSYFRGCTKPPRPSPFTVNVVVDGRFMTLMEGSIGGGRQSASFSR